MTSVARAFGALVVLAFLAPSCASDESPTRVSSSGGAVKQLDGTTVSSVETTALTRLDGAGLAVLDGATPVDSRRVLEARWTEGDAVKSAADRSAPPMVFPSAWSAGSTIYVFGLSCPQVSMELVSDLGQLSIDQVCGQGAEYEVRKLDTETATWSRPDVNVPTGPEGGAFYLAGTGALMFGQTDEGALFVTHLESGEAHTDFEASLADATVRQTCPTSDGSLLLVATASLPARDASQPAPNDVSAWLLSGQGATSLPVPLLPDAVGTFARSACLAQDGVAGGARGSIIDTLELGEDGALSWNQVSLPEKGDAVSVEDSRPGLIAWVPDGRSLTAWRLEGRAFVEGPTIEALDPPRPVVFVGDLFVALQREFLDDGSAVTTVQVTG